MELKRCPFCGREVVMNGCADLKGGPYYYVACECGGNTMGAETKEEAAAKWNRRAEGWIPVEEGLPEEDGECLCCDDYGQMMVGVIFKDQGSNTGVAAVDDDRFMMDVMAWMPLPEPWKGEANG